MASTIKPVVTNSETLYFIGSNKLITYVGVKTKKQKKKITTNSIIRFKIASF